ncbi:MAG: fibronectin type III domain-containing protein, partial [Patescibacteria group bacterium]
YENDFAAYDIYYSTNAGVSYTLLVTNTDLEDNTYLHEVCTSTCVGESYAYKVTTRDNIGNTSGDSNAVQITATGRTTDVSAPLIQSGPTSGTAGVNYIPINWTASEAAFSAVAYELAPFGGSSFENSPAATSTSIVAAGGQHEVNIVGLTPGSPYDYEVRAIDASNNIGRATSSQPFTFPAKTNNTSPSTPSVTVTPKEKTALFEISADKDVIALISDGAHVYGSYQYKRNHTIVPPTNYTASSPLTYTVTIRDINGNEAGTSGSVTHANTGDTFSPVISSTTPIAVDPDAFTATVSWTTDEQSSSFVEYGTATSSQNTALYSNTTGMREFKINHSVKLTGLSSQQQYFFRVRSVDGAGNEVISDQESFTTDAPASTDSAPPVVSGATIVGAHTNSVLMQWSTNEDATSVLEVSKSTSFTDIYRASNPNLTQNHMLEVAGLPDATFWYARIKSADPRGNTVPDSDTIYKFGTLKNTNQIVISNVNVSINEQQTTVTFITNVAAVGYVEYGFNRGLGEVYGNMSPTTNHSIVLPTDLLGKVTYTFRVRARATNGDEETSEDVAIFIAPPSAATEKKDDVTPPVISNIATPIITANSAVVTWRTSELALTALDYGLSTLYGVEVGTSTTDFNTTHSVTLTNLQPNTIYYYQITATDEAGNISSLSADTSGVSFSFKTAEETAGTEEQIVPGECNSTAGIGISGIEAYEVKSKSAKIKWYTNEDTIGTVEYGLSSGSLDDFVSAGPTFKSDFTVSVDSLKTGTEYFYKITALNSCGVQSSSLEKTFTTLASTTEEEALDELEEQLLEEANKQQLELLESFTALSSSTQALLQDFLAGIKLVGEEERAKALKVLFGELAGPPRILGSKPNVTVTDTTAIIEWETLTETNSIVSYASDIEFEDDKDNPYTKEAGKKSEFVTVHKVTLTELKPFTSYNFQISGEEKGGTKTIGINRTFKTLPIQPKFDEFKIGDITEYSVRVSWKTNIPTKAVINIQDRTTGEGRTIEVSDVQLEHEYVAKDLKSETKYALFIVAQSEEGETVRTDPRNFQTSPDNIPPEITSVRTKLTLSTGREDNVQAVITWSTDESSTSQVEYVEGARLEGSNLQKSPTMSDITSSHVIVITRLRPATIYTFRVVSTDAAGNRGESRQFKIFTPRKEESVLELIIKNFEDAFGFLKEL